MRVNYDPYTKQGGFTLIELMATVGFLGVLIAVAMPSFLSTLSGLKLNDAARQVAIQLQQTRMKAIGQNIPYQITFSTSYYTVQKCSGACTNDGGNVVLPDGITLTASATPQFQARGTAAATATITLSNGARQKWVCVKIIGRINIQDSICT